ncbi:MAG: protein yceI precursor [Prosthecochloris sp.]|uniref:YceI family protein n=1 Tax=Prosthecochloris sp. TaxID=290513 RepID=UPI0013C6D9E8|nr:YceI family protein [Prosthecochloris sp.]NEX13050.1 protein yceI precursor [Prosthecochloris sp.]
MKRLTKGLLLGVALLVPDFALASSWKIDSDHSSVGFSIRHLMVSNVKGAFTTFGGTVELDDDKITDSKVSATIDVASINTNVKKRDDHLRSPDFFDVANYPEMTFVSKKWKQAPDGKLRILGDLTMHGVTKEVELDVEPFSAEVRDPWGNIRRGTSATARINRKDFGINYNQVLDNGGLTVGNEVDIELEIELIKTGE